MGFGPMKDDCPWHGLLAHEEYGQDRGATREQALRRLANFAQVLSQPTLHVQ
jgi:hypothetical protein